MVLLLLAVSVLAGSGLLALLAARRPRWCTALGVGGDVLAGVIGLVPALRVLGGGEPESLRRPWQVPYGSFSVELDGLSAFFVVLILVLSALAAVYGGSYLLGQAGRKSLGTAWFFFNLLIASMVLVAIARNAVLFLVAWETMALTSFFLVTFHDEEPEVRAAGWIYLVATHLGTTFLLALFLLLRQPGGSLEFADFAAGGARSPALASLLFLLAVVGFGTKAGFVPFHVWLPEAHPAAPSHVSALLSAVMIKLGIYGLLRVVTFLGTPLLWWGPMLMGIGLTGGLLGIALALQQRDLKRALAYSSIENVGLIALGLGLGLWGWASGQPTIAALGFTGGLLHVWSHGLMKGLMFLAAGSVLHATGTRDLERLGGVLRRMPWTGAAMMLGAVALAALPPLNGFVSEWLLYLGLLQAGLAHADSRGLVALLAVGVLAVIGGMAVLCFVRLTGIVLLGQPRSDAASQAHEASPWMTSPLLVLVLLCLTVAVCPGFVVRLIARPIDQLQGYVSGRTLSELAVSDASLATVGVVNAGVWVAVGGLAAVLVGLYRRNKPVPGPTWGCGYARPTTRMQYTGRSFAEFLAERLLPPALRPHISWKGPLGLFPSGSEFNADSPDPLREGVYEPFFRHGANRLAQLRWLQRGDMHVYLVYILILVALALAWVSLRPGGTS